MMKNKFLRLLFTLLVAVLAVSHVAAQESEQENDTPNPQQVKRPFQLFQELGLSPEQIQQIRRINQERRPIMQEAARRWRQANRDLDLAIYADNSTEEQVKELLKTAQLAQAELLRERSLTEYLIRKVLTPEQLVKFRNLRQQLMEQRVNQRRNMRNPENSDNPQQPRFNRFQRRQNQNRQQ